MWWKLRNAEEKKEKQFIKETVLRTTNGTYYSALFSIEIIQSERNVLCISQLNSSKAPSTQSVKKGAFFFTYTEIEIWFEPYHDRDSTYGAKKGGVHLN